MTHGRPFALLLLFCTALVPMPAVSDPPRPIAPASPSLGLIGEAEAAIAAGDDKRAEGLLARIPAGSLDAIQLARVQIVRAEIGLRRRQPDTVLRSLPPSSSHVSMLSARMEQLRASAQFMLGDVVSAVRTLVARERSLNSAAALAENREQIWNGLVTTPFAQNALDRLDAEDPMTRGWLDLARVLQQGPTSAAIGAWSQRNPGHPGQSKTALIRPGNAPAVASGASNHGPASAPSAGDDSPVLSPLHDPVSLSGGYALLLPVSGSLATAGRAVRDGFVSAWFSLPEPRPALRIYDTGSDAGQAVAAYRNAARDGAGTLIGPLTREAIAAIASQAPTQRWLALNYADGVAGGALQLGVAPEDEARAAATDAIASGRRNALLLAPANAWGDRAIAAFSQAFVQQGGAVLQVTRFANGTQDFGKPLRDLLRLDASTQRHAALDRVLGQTSEFEPRPREDADLLFAPLRVAEVRALVPQLDFFRAKNLPTYTVSAAHNGQVDRQLDGLRLCDMPWVLDGKGAAANERERLRDLFPEAVRTQPRLFALGIDAFRLAQNPQVLAGGQAFDGMTGRLVLAPGNRVARDLSCRAVLDGRTAGGA